MEDEKLQQWPAGKWGVKRDPQKHRNLELRHVVVQEHHQKHHKQVLHNYEDVPEAKVIATNLHKK